MTLWIALFGTSGCSPIGLVNSLSPSAHYVRTADIRYGEHPRHRLDVYVPRDAIQKPPLVVFFYGGGWRSGDKNQYEFVASSLTRAGYAVLIPNYRLYPDVVFPAFIEDGARAVAWAYEQAEAFNMDTQRLFLMGHSAGAHLAVMLGTDQRYLSAHSVCLGALQGVVGLSGPYDFLPINSSYLVDLFPKALRAASQPINFVSAATPPMLLVHGVEDDVVRAANSQSLARKLEDHGVEVTLKLYDRKDHVAVAAALAPPLNFTGDTLEDTLHFLNAHQNASNCHSR